MARFGCKYSYDIQHNVLNGNPTLKIRKKYKKYQFSPNITEDIIHSINIEEKTKFEDETVNIIAKLPEIFKNETRIIISKPVCIVEIEDTLILQYSTLGYNYVRFFIVNLSTKTVKCFEDEHHYFGKSIHENVHNLGPIECHMSSDHEIMILRLPSPVLSSHKWSSMLIAKTTDYISDLDISLDLDRLRDRQNHVISFDPNSPRNVVTALIDEFCAKMKIIVLNIQTKANIHEKIIKLPQPYQPCSDFNSSDTETDSDIDDYAFNSVQLKQCDLVHNKFGNIMVLSCLVTVRDRKKELRIFSIDTSTYKVLGVTFKTLDPFSSSMIPLQRPYFSKCDTACIVCAKQSTGPHSGPCQIIHVEKIPVCLNLQFLCRSVILQSLPVDYKADFKDFPMPPKLIKFIFKGHE